MQRPSSSLCLVDPFKSYCASDCIRYPPPRSYQEPQNALSAARQPARVATSRARYSDARAAAWLPRASASVAQLFLKRESFAGDVAARGKGTRLSPLPHARRAPDCRHRGGGDATATATRHPTPRRFSRALTRRLCAAARACRYVHAVCHCAHRQGGAATAQRGRTRTFRKETAQLFTHTRSAK